MAVGETLGDWVRSIYISAISQLLTIAESSHSVPWPWWPAWSGSPDRTVLSLATDPCLILGHLSHLVGIGYSESFEYPLKGVLVIQRFSS